MPKIYRGGANEGFLSNPINIAILAIFTIIISLLYHYNPWNLLSNHGFAVLLTSMMLFFFIITTMIFRSTGQFTGEPWEKFKKYSKAWGTIGLFFASLFGIIVLFALLIWLFSTSGAFIVLFKIIFSMFILVGAMALFMLRYGDNIKSSYAGESRAFTSHKIVDFILNMIFYIPCLFLDFIEYIKEEYKITPKIAWILLGIEFILVGLRFFIPWLIKIFNNHEGTHLLKDNVYTNTEHMLGTYEDLADKEDTFSYNYALSFWIWINPQPPNTNAAYNRYTTLLSYGDKPRISYNSSIKTLQVEVQLNKEKKTIIYETVDIPFQKWVNFTINYDSGTLDVFIDGELVGTRGGIAPFLSHEAIIAGSEPGIHGGIRDVIYYKKVLSKQQIKWILSQN
jgi:hypothetical protein